MSVWERSRINYILITWNRTGAWLAPDIESSQLADDDMSLDCRSRDVTWEGSQLEEAWEDTCSYWVQQSRLSEISSTKTKRKIRFRVPLDILWPSGGTWRTCLRRPYKRVGGRWHSCNAIEHAAIYKLKVCCRKRDSHRCDSPNEVMVAAEGYQQKGTVR